MLRVTPYTKRQMINYVVAFDEATKHDERRRGHEGKQEIYTQAEC